MNKLTHLICFIIKHIHSHKCLFLPTSGWPCEETLPLGLVQAGSVGGLFAFEPHCGVEAFSKTFQWTKPFFCAARLHLHLHLPSSMPPCDSTPTSSKTNFIAGLTDPSVVLLNNLLPLHQKETAMNHSTHSIYEWMTYPQHFHLRTLQQSSTHADLHSSKSEDWYRRQSRDTSPTLI